MNRIQGIVGATLVAAAVMMSGGVAHAQGDTGYRLMATDGGVFDYGSAQFEGAGSPYPTAATPNATCPNGMIMIGCSAFASTPSGNGYWELGVFPPVVTAYGDATQYGQPADYYQANDIPHALTPSAVAIVSTVDGQGYWVVMFDGTVFAYGDADSSIQGYTPAANQYVVGAARTADGHGLWILQSDGGVFSLGDAKFYGSTGGQRLNQPIVGMAATRGGGGYWLVASDGGVFAYGDAQFYGSTGSLKLNQPVVGMASTSDSGGYWLVATDGGVFAYGDAPFLGSAGGLHLNQPVTAIAAG